MGVEREVITEGDGATSPSSGDMLTMHYVGTLVEGGSEFDSSYRRNKPFQFVIGIGQVIRGWDEGIIDMTLGEKAVLTMTRYVEIITNISHSLRVPNKPKLTDSLRMPLIYCISNFPWLGTIMTLATTGMEKMVLLQPSHRMPLSNLR